MSAACFMGGSVGGGLMAGGGLHGRIIISVTWQIIDQPLKHIDHISCSHMHCWQEHSLPVLAT